MSDFPRSAFILGAGLGTRLRPLTENCPKPLLPIAGRPMVLQAMEKLRAAGTKRFLINTHHCPEAWTAAFPEGKFGDAEVRLIHEPVILETGGGLANIASLLGDEDAHLVIWNGDILSDCDIAAAFAHHRDNGGEATLVVREQGPNRNVRITDDGAVTDMRGRLGGTDTAYQYAGICFATKAFVLGLPAAAESLVEHFLRRIQAQPGSIQGYLDSSASWHDLGTVEEYLAVKARLEKPVRGAIAPAEAAQAHGYGLIEGGEVLKGGSGRRFHRVRNAGGETAVLCVYDDSRPENLIYGDLAGMLRDKIGAHAPAVIAEDKDAGVLILEDLGATDLWSLAEGAEFPWVAVASALEQVASLHRHGAEAAASSGVTLMEAFGPNLYQWERQYFQDNVLAGRKVDRGVLDEMASLAKELTAQSPVVIHRDFQSQNIMVRDGKAWLIDFQGMRFGSMFYDFASLAFDPYLRRSDMDLWRIEIEDHAREVSDWKGSSDEFSHLFHVAATQRLLQACGAYGFLGHKKGRPEYLAHLPQGLHNLTIAASLCGKRRLARLAEELAGATAKVSR
jgi:NDP-sugar pyrophosphorylase family protein/aminoglycoside/choline kinase family phosphotransferase